MVQNFIQQKGNAYLLATDSQTFRADHMLHQEIFGPATLLVRCGSMDDLIELASELEGQLTATIHAEPEESALAQDLVNQLREKAGRIVWNGYPTGVEVAPSMHHGGPYPATTDSRFTSVGTAAIQRFAKPVCYQNFPYDLLPGELQNTNTRQLWRLVNGILSKEDILPG
jgi:2,5-dioxopentanoate dehydrogenase